ncbi:hypothetical protein JW948_15170 [bacterium]|nr:hypothetical protein [bacterium]
MALEMVFIERIWIELLEAADIPCFIMDGQGRLIDANSSLKSWIGYASWQDITDKNLFQYLGLNNRQPELRKHLQDHGLNQYPLDIEYRGKKKHIRLTCREMQVHLHQMPLYYGMIIDDTEKTELIQKWKTSQKEMILGRLTGEVIHDYNNVNNIIQNCTDLIHSQLPAGDPNQADLEAISQASKKASDLTGKLLSFLQNEPSDHPETFSVHEQLHRMTDLILHLMQKHIRIETHLLADEDTIYGEISAFENILMNLFINAKEAMPDGGTLTLMTQNVYMIEAAPVQEKMLLRPVNYLYLQVRDTGKGIPQEIQKDIFKPFYTTRPDGTGLGLSIVRESVRHFKGHISVSSCPEEGSAFHLYLPLSNPSS